MPVTLTAVNTCVHTITVILKMYRPTLKNKAHPPFSNEIVAKDAFLSKVHPPIYATVPAVTLSKKHQRSSTVQEEALTNHSRHHLLLLHKQAHDKRSIKKSLQAYRNTSRLTACELTRWAYSRRISHLSKICPPPSLRSHLSSSLMGIFSRDYC